MAEHDLKVWPECFEAIVAGIKTFEVRKNDRNYQVGDVLQLREYAPGPDEYTGRETKCTVSYIVSGDKPQGYAFGVRPGFVVMALNYY